MVLYTRSFLERVRLPVLAVSMNRPLYFGHTRLARRVLPTPHCRVYFGWGGEGEMRPHRQWQPCFAGQAGVNYLVGVAMAAQARPDDRRRAQKPLVTAVKQCMEWKYDEGTL